MSKISVCVATYNGEKYIKEQLLSILEQITSQDELIISDDCSTDSTLEIINSLNDQRIKIYSGQCFGSPIYNFENAIKNATGDIIFLADQDDIWLKGKVDTMLPFFNKFDIVVSDCYMGDQDLNIVKDSYFAWRNSKSGLFKNLWRNSYLGCCMAFKKDILQKILPFPKRVPMHDMWIGLVGEMFYKTFFLDKQLMIYRRHGGNVTSLSKQFKSTATSFQMAKYRWDLLIPLIRRVLK